MSIDIGHTLQEGDTMKSNYMHFHDYVVRNATLIIAGENMK